MNKAKLAIMAGMRLRIWPPMLRIDPIRGGLASLEFHQWEVESATKERMLLYNPSITQRFCLPTDHIIDYRRDDPYSDGLLVLKSQVTLRSNVITLEPLPQKAIRPTA